MKHRQRETDLDIFPNLCFIRVSSVAKEKIYFSSWSAGFTPFFAPLKP